MKSRWIYYMPIHLPRLLIIIVDDCSWSNNLCIMTVDKWCIEIHIVQKTIPLIGRYMKMIMIEILELWTSFWTPKGVNNSWVDTTFVKVHWYSPCKRKSPLCVSWNYIHLNYSIKRSMYTLRMMILCNVDEDFWAIKLYMSRHKIYWLEQS